LVFFTSISVINSTSSPSSSLLVSLSSSGITIPILLPYLDFLATVTCQRRNNAYKNVKYIIFMFYLYLCFIYIYLYTIKNCVKGGRFKKADFGPIHIMSIFTKIYFLRSIIFNLNDFSLNETVIYLRCYISRKLIF